MRGCAGGGAVEPRSRISVGKRYDSGTRAGEESCKSSISTAFSPIFCRGCETVVSCGSMSSVFGTASNPVSEMSPGMDTPWLRSA